MQRRFGSTAGDWKSADGRWLFVRPFLLDSNGLPSGKRSHQWTIGVFYPDPKQIEFLKETGLWGTLFPTRKEATVALELALAETNYVPG